MSCVILDGKWDTENGKLSETKKSTKKTSLDTKTSCWIVLFCSEYWKTNLQMLKRLEAETILLAILPTENTVDRICEIWIRFI